MKISNVSGGSLAVQAIHRQILKEICLQIGGLGHFHQLLVILEKAWAARDARANVETHWRNFIDDFGWTLLFN